MNVSDAYLFHIILTTLVLAAGTLYGWHRGWLQFYSPVFMFIISFALMYLLHPLAIYLLRAFYVYEPWFAKLDWSYADVIVYASIVINLGIVALFAGFAVRPRRRFPWPQLDLKDHPHITAAVFVPLLLYGLYSQIIYQGTGIFDAASSGGTVTLYGYSLTGKITGYTLDAHHLAQPICLMLLLWRRTRKIGALLFLVYVYLRLQSAWARGALVTFGLSALCLHLLLSRRHWPHLRQAAFVVVIGLVLVARGHQELRHTGILNLVRSSELGGSVAAFLATTNFNQFEAGAYLISLSDDIFDDTGSYDWGRALLAMPARLLPRRFFPWKDRVREAIEGDAGRLYWERLAVIRPNNMGIIAGFYRYAGPLGTVSCMFVLGLVFRRIYETMRSDAPDYLRIVCCIVTGAIIMETRQELEWYVARLIFLLGPILCAVAVCAFHRIMSRVYVPAIPAKPLLAVGGFDP